MIANDSEAPESWLEWFGWRKLVFGPNAHRRWHYTGPLGPPNRHVKWFVRSVGAPPPETAINLWHSLVAWVTRIDPPWVEEWREAVEAEEEEETEAASNEQHVSMSATVSQVKKGDVPSAPRVLRLLHIDQQVQLEVHALGDGNEKVHAADDDDRASTSSSVRSARALARYKRIIALTGFVGVFVTWAIFSWFIFVRAFGLCIFFASVLTCRCVSGLRDAHLQTAGRSGAAAVRALLGRVVRHERGFRVEGRPDGVRQGRNHPGHLGAAVRHALRLLV